MPPLPRHSVVLLVQFWNLPLTPTTVRPDPDSNQTAECRYLLDTLAPIGALRRFTLRPGSRLTRSFLVEVLHRYSNHTFRLGELKKVLKRTWGRPQRREPVHVLSRPHALRRRLSDKQVADVVAAYRDGATAADLAARYGVARSALVFLLHEHGLALRNHGLSSGQREEARRLRAKGETYVAIGERFGVHRSTVWHAVNSPS